MGTSSSSSGSPSGTRIVPPWVPSIGPQGSEDGDENQDGQPTNSDDSENLGNTIPNAPSGRYGPARRSLGSFAGNGSKDDLRRGLGHYVKKGMGGSKTAALRCGGTIQTAGALYGALTAIGGGQAVSEGSPLSPDALKGKSAKEIINIIIEEVQPINGTQDTEASREAISHALSELYNRYPETDIFNLSEQEKTSLIELYISRDIFNRVCLEVGKTIQEKAQTASIAVHRLKEVFDYVKESISAAFRKLRNSGEKLSNKQISTITHQTLENTFEVFVGELS